LILQRLSRIWARCIPTKMSLTTIFMNGKHTCNVRHTMKRLDLQTYALRLGGPDIQNGRTVGTYMTMRLPQQGLDIFAALPSDTSRAHVNMAYHIPLQEWHLDATPVDTQSQVSILYKYPTLPNHFRQFLKYKSSSSSARLFLELLNLIHA